MASKGVKKAPKKGAKGYKLPEPIPVGQILSDTAKKQWILGKSIGVGGFGEIYSATPYSEKTSKNYSYVVKIEPHGNGPLFVEMHFYMRNAKADEIENWRKMKNLSVLGMPRYVSSGSLEHKSERYRFVVMDRYGTDLWKLFVENNRQFPEHTVYKVAWQVLNVLEYIHNQTYIHADIKGANLLLDMKHQDHVYLVDFGLASHVTKKSEYKLDPKKAHNGTPEYTSRDAHMGVPTMRGDLEILLYNMIQWLCGSLPWEKNLSDLPGIQKQKESAFKNVTKFLKECFEKQIPSTIEKFMNVLSAVEFDETPDYDKFSGILTEGLKKLGHKTNGKLDFKSDNNNSKPSPTLKPVASKVKNPVITKRKSPRILKIKPTAVSNNFLDESTIGVVMDKKRGGAIDMIEAIRNMDSDEEYDIKIVKKKKKPTGNTKKENEGTEKVKTMRKSPRNRTVDSIDSQTSESETPKKHSRLKATNNKRSKTTSKNRVQSRYLDDDSSSDDN